VISGFTGSVFQHKIRSSSFKAIFWLRVKLSVGNLAIFAGGFGNNGDLNIMDIYNATSGTWTTSVISVPRTTLAATSVGNLAIFAGGQVNWFFFKCSGYLQCDFWNMDNFSSFCWAIWLNRHNCWKLCDICWWL
jgi:hypothetical protein